MLTSIALLIALVAVVVGGVIWALIHGAIENHRAWKGVTIYREQPDGTLKRIK